MAKQSPKLNKITNKDDLGFEKTVDELDAEELRSNTSDVPVNEDGLAEGEMLAGYVDGDGYVHKTFLYREMNGRDEEALNKTEVRSNPAKLMNTLVERCVEQIGSITKKSVGTAEWGKIVRSLYGGDIDYIALKIREISKGDEIIFEHKCPKCRTKLKTIVSTKEYSVNEFNGEHELSFELPRGYKDKKGVLHKEGTLRHMNGFDREIIVPEFKKNPAKGTTKLLTRLMSFDDNTVVFEDTVADMSLRDREYLERLINEMTFGLDTSIDIFCTTCGEELSGDVGTTNFF